MTTFRKIVMVLALCIIIGSIFLILNGKWPLDKVGDTYTGINIPNDQSSPVSMEVTSMRELPQEEVASDPTTAPVQAASLSLFNDLGIDQEGWSFYNPPLEVPEVVFYAGEDQEVKLSRFQGKKLLLNLWATWCAPCVEELPTLANLKSTLIERRSAVDVITVSMDMQEDFENIRSFLDRNGAENLPNYMDTANSIMNQFNLSGFPVTYIFNPDGQMIAKYDGPLHWSDAKIVEMLEKL